MVRKKNIAVSAIASHSLKSPKYARLLFRIVNYFKPQSMLELGTSLGLSTIYQAKANEHAKFISIEGSNAVAEIAQQNFNCLKADNIQLIQGSFEEKLPEALKQFEKLDYVFFDGNHRKEATLNYFEICLQKASANAVFIFDDINWSDEMKEAWNEIKNHPRVFISIDLFMMGIVFFNPDFSKQHFTIRF